MKIVSKIFNWIFSIFCISSLMAYGVTIPSILMTILGIASLPIEAIRNIWKKFPAYKILRPVIISILFIAFCCMMPTENTNTEIAESSRDTVIEESHDIVESEVSATTKEIEESASIEKSVEEETIKADPEAIEESKEQEKADTKQIETEEPTTSNEEEASATQTKPSTEVTLSVASIPKYSGSPYVTINDNVPQFLETDMSTTSYEYYSDLDNLGRCGVVYACIGRDIMPTEERGEIGMVKPSGWHTVKYPDIIKDLYLYNRCHLIGYQLAGENANTKNLITGTRYMNVDGMLPFEDKIADYVKETGNHVVYRVTPVFDGDNLLASGVQMEAKSVEDNGEGILFNVFCYNVQPGIIIDYTSGESSAEVVQTKAQQEPVKQVVQHEEVQEVVHIMPQEVQQTTEPEPTVAPVLESTPEQQPTESSFAVNAKNGKIHIVGACTATGTGKQAMKEPVYFSTYEEAENYSIQHHPGEDKRRCGNCYK